MNKDYVHSMQDDTISRKAATQTALEFIVEYLGGAFDEDFQKMLMKRMNALPSAQSELLESAYAEGYTAAEADFHKSRREWYMKGYRDAQDCISRKAMEAIKSLPITLDAETIQRCIEVISNMSSAHPQRTGR